jgi:hypothetical protein
MSRNDGRVTPIQGAMMKTVGEGFRSLTPEMPFIAAHTSSDGFLEFAKETI